MIARPRVTNVDRFVDRFVDRHSSSWRVPSPRATCGSPACVALLTPAAKYLHSSTRLARLAPNRRVTRQAQALSGEVVVLVHGRARLVSVAALAVLAGSVVVASLAWACTGNGFGTPATPGAEPSPPPPPAPTAPSPGGVGATPPPAVGPPAGGVASPPAQATPTSPGPGGVGAGSQSSASGSSSGSGSGSSASSSTSGAGGSSSTSGARGTGSAGSDSSRGARSRGGSRGGASFGTSGPGTGGPSDFAARESGATGGVARSGGQSVFASSVAPKGSATSREPSRARAGSPSVRSAGSDLWSGFGSGSRSSVSAASSAAPGSGGLSSAAVAGIAILALGMSGVLGASGVAASRRRRSRAGSRNTTGK